MRFKLIRDDRVFEAALDQRLSFIDNFKYIVQISDFDVKGLKVYDPIKKVFLNNEVPIEVFNINSYMLMYLF